MIECANSLGLVYTPKRTPFKQVLEQLTKNVILYFAQKIVINDLIDQLSSVQSEAITHSH